MHLKNAVIGIAIIILTIFVTFYAINTIFPKPAYSDFCNTTSVNGGVYTNQSACAAAGGTWNGAIGPKANASTEGYCDLYYRCSQQYDSVLKARSEKVFFVALPLGIAVIAVGAFAFGLEAVGAGLMGGGVGTLIYGAGAYWPYTENWIRFVLSLVGLVILIWIAYFFNNRFHNGKFRKKKR